MADFLRQYWDSPLFIAYLVANEPKKLRVLDELFGLLQERRIQVVVSTAGLAEIRPMPLENTATPADESQVETVPYTPEHEEKLRTLIESDLLDIRGVTPRVGLDAAKIGSQFPRLLPMDCIHIATAIEAKADVLFTWDGAGKRRRPGDMLRYDRRIGDPPLNIATPFNPIPRLDLP